MRYVVSQNPNSSQITATYERLQATAQDILAHHTPAKGTYYDPETDEEFYKTGMEFGAGTDPALLSEVRFYAAHQLPQSSEATGITPEHAALHLAEIAEYAGRLTVPLAS